jgi:hypothetical protein
VGRVRRALLAWALAWVCAPWAQAQTVSGSLRYCDAPTTFSAAQQDLLLRFASLVKAELAQSGQRLALISRSGTDLSRLGLRYSHAGISLQASANAPWSVRQLYYACDEQLPRLFDQGLSGFLLGADRPELGYISLVFLPTAEASELERVALDKAQALALLDTRYSANAYAFSLRYQNCNQWVAELLAAAWGAAPSTEDTPRAAAQRWLQDQGYAPSVVEVGALMGLSVFITWVHNDDHPAADLARNRYRVSMPASIERFVHARLPGATRVELCHAGRQVVIRRGWEAIAEGCQPGPGDEQVTLN